MNCSCIGGDIKSSWEKVARWMERSFAHPFFWVLLRSLLQSMKGILYMLIFPLFCLKLENKVSIHVDFRTYCCEYSQVQNFKIDVCTVHITYIWLCLERCTILFHDLSEFFFFFWKQEGIRSYNWTQCFFCIGERENYSVFTFSRI